MQAGVAKVAGQKDHLLDEGLLNGRRSFSQRFEGALAEQNVHRDFTRVGWDLALRWAFRRALRYAAICSPSLKGPCKGVFSAALRRALRTRRCSGVYSASAVGKV